MTEAQRHAGDRIPALELEVKNLQSRTKQVHEKHAVELAQLNNRVQEAETRETAKVRHLEEESRKLEEKLQQHGRYETIAGELFHWRLFTVLVRSKNLGIRDGKANLIFLMLKIGVGLFPVIAVVCLLVSEAQLQMQIWVSEAALYPFAQGDGFYVFDLES